MSESVSFHTLIGALTKDGINAHHIGEEKRELKDAHTFRVWNRGQVETFLLHNDDQKKAAEIFNRLGLNFCAVEKQGQENRPLEWYPYGHKTNENLPRGGVTFMEYVER